MSRAGLWRVEPALARAAGRAGATVADLLTFLEAHAGAAPAAWRASLALCWQPHPSATLRRALLVEMADGAGPLPTTRPGLSTVVAQTFSPRAAEVAAGRAPALRRLLAGAGVDLHEDDRAIGGAVEWGRPAEPVALAVALEALYLLAERGMPTPPLQAATRERLGLSEGEAMAVAIWTRRLRAALDDRLDPTSAAEGMVTSDAGDPDQGRGAPVEAHSALDPVVTRALLQAAIERGGQVRLRYAPPAGQPPHWRTVAPHRLESRGGHGYLRAHCYLRGAERLFRLDRVLACDAAPPDACAAPTSARA